MFAMHVGAAQIFLRNFLMRHGFYHIGAGHEHIAAATHHHREIGERGRIHRTPGAGPHDQRNLRHHAARQHVALENFSETRQRIHAFLNPRTAGIVDPDNRRAHFHRHVLHFADFFGVGLRQRPTKHGEILTIHEHQAAIDGALTRNYAIARDFFAGHIEIDAAMLDEHVIFLETIGVEQHLQPLARGEFTFFVLPVDAGLTTPKPCGFALQFEFFNNSDGVH